MYFVTYFTHREQSPERQQPIKEPSLKYYPFLLFNVSSLIRDRNIPLGRMYWRYNSLILLSIVELHGIIFLGRLTIDE